MKSPLLEVVGQNRRTLRCWNTRGTSRVGVRRGPSRGNGRREIERYVASNSRRSMAGPARYAEVSNSVALEGGTALIGSWLADPGGSAYVFALDVAGTWVQQTRLKASDATETDLFGDSVALDGDTASSATPTPSRATCSPRTRGNGRGRPSSRADLGTDPNQSDIDGDGIVDGQDPDIVVTVVEDLGDDDFSSNGHRQATQGRLRNTEKSIDKGHTDQAIRKLDNLRGHVDGCGVTADRNDWIEDCDAQRCVRELIDLLITNLGG